MMQKGKKRTRNVDRKEEEEEGRCSVRSSKGAEASRAAGKSKDRGQNPTQQNADFKRVDLFEIPPIDREGEAAGQLTLPKALHQFLPGRFPSMTSAKRAVRKGIIMVDEVKGNTSLICRAGQRVSLMERRRVSRMIFQDKSAPPLPDVKVLHENQDYAIVVKPVGIVTIGKSDGPTLQSMISRILKPSSSTMGAVLRKPRCCHRLDKPTGGLVVCAKTRQGQERILDAFRKRVINKKYQAVVEGHLKECGIVDRNLDGKESITKYKPVRHYNQEDLRKLGGGTLAEKLPNGATLVDMWPKTGRTHQLRRHAKYLGHPLVGDSRYGSPAAIDPKFFYLWAVELCSDTTSNKSAGNKDTQTSKDRILDPSSFKFSIVPPAFPNAPGTGGKDNEYKG